MAQVDWLAARSPSASVKAEAAIRDYLKMLAVFLAVGLPINPTERKLVIPFGRHAFIASTGSKQTAW